MSSDHSVVIDPEQLAVSGKRLSGTLMLKQMGRLAELVDIDKGNVSYDLHFSRNEKGNIRITGEIESILTVLCQRCLNSMQIPVQLEVSIGVLTVQDRLEDLADDLEPFQAEEEEISLLKLIEDEILLGLPISPMHDMEDCPAAEIIKQNKSVNENPFAVLKSLKQGKN